MTRVGLIRDVITAAGGSSNFMYYADGPRSGMGPSRGKGAHQGRQTGDHRVSYKIESYSDGFKTREQRERVVEQLKLLPDVEAAYVTRPCATRWRITNAEGNIKVIFKNRAR